MCGIIGMIATTGSGFGTSETDVFKELLFADALRGDDSTGMFMVNRDANVDYLKVAKPSWDVITTKDYDDFSNDIFRTGCIAVGHNRKATKGTITDENAHPFYEKNTILVHNGTIFNQDALATEKVTVDSHAILHGIVEHGATKTLPAINGAYALSWYDAEAKIFYLARNKERPLFVANTPGCWFFASEKEMLGWILRRNRISVKDWTDLDPGYLYKFAFDKLDTMRIQKLPERKEVQSAVVTPLKPTFRGSSTPVAPLTRRTELARLVDAHAKLKQEPKETPSQTSSSGGVEENQTRAPTKKPAKGGGKPATVAVDPTLFRSGHQYTIDVDSVSNTVSTDGEFIGFANGTLHLQPDVQCRVWFSLKEKDLLDQLLKDPSDIITASMTFRYVKNDILRSLHFKSPVKLVSTNDAEGNEIFPDDLGILDTVCFWCKENITWEMVPTSGVRTDRKAGLFSPKKCVCPKCREIMVSSEV